MIVCEPNHESIAVALGECVHVSWTDEEGTLTSESNREGMVKMKADDGFELEDYNLGSLGD